MSTAAYRRVGARRRRTPKLQSAQGSRSRSRTTASSRPPAPRLDRRSLAEVLIDARGPIYAELRDPFRAWEAFWLAWCFRDAAPTHSGGVATPEWVTSYFERVARQMIGISRSEHNGKQLASAILHALEINGRGRGAIFTKRRKLRKAQQYVADVLALVSKGAKPYLAIEEVAKFHGVHRSTVGRDWREAKGRRGFLEPGGWEPPTTPSPCLLGGAPSSASTPSSKPPD